MGSNVFRAEFGSGLICPRAQTCMDSKVVRADFWELTDLPPGSNMLRRAAQTCSACKLAGVQISPLPTLANQILVRTFFRLRRVFVCVSSRWKVLSGEFRRPFDFRKLYGLKWATSVEKRHQLPISEARRCSACANPFACPAVGKFSRASSAGGRLHLQTNSFYLIVSVAEDCLSPERTFHG